MQSIRHKLGKVSSNFAHKHLCTDILFVYMTPDLAFKINIQSKPALSSNEESCESPLRCSGDHGLPSGLS